LAPQSTTNVDAVWMDVSPWPRILFFRTAILDGIGHAELLTETVVWELDLTHGQIDEYT
jgi:hypothetical protein